MHWGGGEVARDIGWHGPKRVAKAAPIAAAALRAARLVKNSTLKVYAGAPHGLADTHKDKLNADLLAFLKG